MIQECDKLPRFFCKPKETKKRNSPNIKASLDVPTRIKLIYNQVLSCVDFYNVLLLGALDKDLRPLTNN